jgi:hypothetical protein
VPVAPTYGARDWHRCFRDKFSTPQYWIQKHREALAKSGTIRRG